MNRKNEDIDAILSHLFDALIITRAGEHLTGITPYMRGSDEYVRVSWIGGVHKDVCITADSGLAVIKDVLKAFD